MSPRFSFVRDPVRFAIHRREKIRENPVDECGDTNHIFSIMRHNFRLHASHTAQASCASAAAAALRAPKTVMRRAWLVRRESPGAA